MLLRTKSKPHSAADRCRQHALVTFPGKRDERNFVVADRLQFQPVRAVRFCAPATIPLHWLAIFT